MFKFGVLCLVVIAVGALPIDEDRIIGGQEAKRGQFPHIVSIRLRRSGRHICGGSILNDRIVLTAAHCMVGDSASIFNVLLAVGAHRRFNDGTLHFLTKIVPHPAYNARTRSNDICILQSRDKFQFNQFVRPAKLPTAAFPDANFLPLILAGWGQNRAGAPSLEPSAHPTFLQYRLTPSLSRRDCISRLSGLGNLVHVNTICTFNIYGQGACIGDSGGPLMDRQQVLVGVVSWGVAPCGRGIPDVFARVFSHIGFINSTIASLA